MASRPIDIIVINDTNSTLKFGYAIALRGKVPYVSLGDDTLVANGGRCTVHAEEKDFVDDFGLQGSFSFLFQDYSERVFNFAYNYPMEICQTYARVSGPTGYNYNTNINHLSANSAVYTITLQKLE
ncbi:MAG: hypothetical protein K0Q53_1353 [Massilibacillus sp.]|jgi:hypothetical protein|nr:hypothetical protein [Massilibacillus sp.]